jgi:hypothetical protein
MFQIGFFYSTNPFASYKAHSLIQFVFANQIESLADKIKKNQQIKPLLRANIQNDPLINWKWLFGLFIAFLALEWFVRKRTGNY